jgi:hypothetical protein
MDTQSFVYIFKQSTITKASVFVGTDTFYTNYEKGFWF